MTLTQARALTAVLLAVLAVAVAYKAGSRTEPLVSPKLIEVAQKTSFLGARPSWVGLTDNDALFAAMRDRGYAFCAKAGRIDNKCAAGQDEAIQFAVLSLVVAEAQRKMPDKAALGLKERWVATNPEVVPRVLNDCWALYKLHGAKDARLLSVCLGNLTDASSLVPLPVS